MHTGHFHHKMTVCGETLPPDTSSKKVNSLCAKHCMLHLTVLHQLAPVAPLLPPAVAPRVEFLKWPDFVVNNSLKHILHIFKSHNLFTLTPSFFSHFTLPDRISRAVVCGKRPAIYAAVGSLVSLFIHSGSCDIDHWVTREAQFFGEFSVSKDAESRPHCDACFRSCRAWLPTACNLLEIKACQPV